MEILKPNENRAKNAIFLIWIVLAFDIVSLISSYLQYNLLQTASLGRDLSTEAVNSNDLREQIVGLLYFAAYITSAVTFILWFRRAYYNLHLKVTNLTHSEGWAAGSWFVPIFNLYRPFQIMKEIYQETKIILIDKDALSKYKLTTKYLGVWWTLWIISGFIGQFEFRYLQKASAIDEFITGTIASMINNIIGIPLALITIKIIKDYSNIEPLLYRSTETENEEDTQDYLTGYEID